uniref:Ficolin-1 n=1 Tax=Culex pipiens TaxID=7175 RepID=A0A8D8B270_CULPI
MIRLLNAILLIATVKYAGANFIENENIQNSSRSVSFTNLPRTCSLATSRHSGVQLIHPQPGFREPFEVFCDQEYEGGGWIVIQNRYDGSVHFYRDWDEYERGFGDLEEEMWLGLGKIHELTYSRRYELHVVLEDWEGIRAVARYSDFLVAGPAEKYMLRSLGSFSGNAGDSLGAHLDMKFTTFNADNDLNTGNCAVAWYGAWWYRNCHHSNLNGRYMQGFNRSGMDWRHFRPDGYSLRKSRMMIRVAQ